MGKILVIAAFVLATAKAFAGVSGGTNFLPEDLGSSLPPDEAFARWAQAHADKDPPAPTGSTPPHGDGRGSTPGK